MKSKTFVGWTHKGWCVYWDLDSLTIPYIVQTKKYYIERARRIWTKMEKPIRVEVIIREV